METIRKRALEDIDNQLAAHFRKRRRQDQASDTNTPTQPMTTSNPSIAASSPTLIGSPAPVTPSRTLHPSTPPSYLSSSASSETSETESDSSGSSSGESDSVGYASTSSADQQPRSHLPSLLPRVISPETSSSSSSGTSTDSGSYTSASVSDDITDLLSSSSSSEDSEDDDDEVSSSSSGSSSSSSSSSGSSSSDSDLSSSTSNSLQPSLPPHLSVASLTADNLSTLQSRLNALLPKMKDANAILEAERKEGRLNERNIENIGDTEGAGQDGEYIEMNLGLGVLEQRGEEVENSGSGERDDESGDEREERESDEPEERDLMGRLLNRNGVVKSNSRALVRGRSVRSKHNARYHW